MNKINEALQHLENAGLTIHASNEGADTGNSSAKEYYENYLYGSEKVLSFIPYHIDNIYNLELELLLNKIDSYYDSDNVELTLLDELENISCCDSIDEFENIILRRGLSCNLTDDIILECNLILNSILKQIEEIRLSIENNS